MTEIGNLLQTALDASLAAEGVYSYWLRKSETASEDNKEYIVYTLNEDSNNEFADDSPLIKAASVTVKYYFHDSFLDTYEGRQLVKRRAEVIQQSLLGASFTCPNGFFDAGDIEDNGFGVKIYEAEYWRVV